MFGASSAAPAHEGATKCSWISLNCNRVSEATDVPNRKTSERWSSLLFGTGAWGMHAADAARPRRTATSPKAQGVDLRPRLAGPVWVYNNWSAYDELSDAVPPNEPLAMRELAEMLRLRNAGVHFDYYVMGAFWYDPDGGYRIWRREDWPDGPHRWIAACQAAGVKPGLWFSSNTLTSMKPAPQWQSSLNASGTAMSLYSGAFLDDFMDVLQHWYERGIRMFKLDFADFTVAAKGDENRLRPQEIRLRNGRALHAALRTFRRNHPDVVLVAFNGFVGDVDSAASSLDPFNVQ
jgi:hypothetical protein